MNWLRKLFPPRTPPDPRCGVVLVAAGRAQRMEGLDKALLPMGNIPVLIRSLQPFQASPLVEEMVVVTRPDLLVEAAQLCRDYHLDKVCRLLPGGETRSHSVLAGLAALSPHLELAAIHDGARPFVTREVLEEAIRAAARTGAAAPGLPVKDTIKVVEGDRVARTLPRDTLRAIQTPQVFETSLIKAALSKALQEGVPLTDDCAAVERLGFPVTVTQGSEENIKLTTPADLALGEAIIARRDGW